MANFNFNKVILGGRLTHDPELKTTQSGTAYTDFNIAVNRQRVKDAEPITDFIHVIAWRQRAELVSRYFHKGSSICVTGTIQTRSWTDSQGNKRYATDVVADEVNFVDAKGEGTKEIAQNASYVPSSEPSPPVFEELTDDDELPF